MKAKKLKCQMMVMEMNKKAMQFRKKAFELARPYPFFHRLRLYFDILCLNWIAKIGTKILFRNLAHVNDGSLHEIDVQRYEYSFAFYRYEGLRAFGEIVGRVSYGEHYSGDNRKIILVAMESAVKSGFVNPIDLTRFEISSILHESAKRGLFEWMSAETEKLIQLREIAEEERQEKEKEGE